MVPQCLPRGWPRRARAAPLTKIGIDDLKPRIVVEGSHSDTGRMTRGWKQYRENARAFSWFAGDTMRADEVWQGGSVLTELLVGGGRVVRPGLVG